MAQNDSHSIRCSIMSVYIPSKNRGVKTASEYVIRPIVKIFENLCVFL